MNVEDLISEWKKSRDFVKGYSKDFVDLNTIANAQYPRSNGKKPNVGDTTIAGTIRQMMRRAVKQPPVVSVAINGTKQSEQAIICRYLVNNCILNPVTFGKNFVSNLQLGGRGALTRGFNAFQVKSTKMYGEYGIIPQLIHHSNLGIEPGVHDANLSSYWYVKTQFTPTKLKSIYNKEKKNKNTTWNIKALKALIDAGPDGSGETEYAEWLIPSEMGNDTASDVYIVVTKISADPDDDLVSFSPSLSQSLRTVPNRSKFGYPRVLFLVIDPAELSPFGDSRVRLASPNQNLAMALRQNVATTWLYNSDPTVVYTGLFTGSKQLKSGGSISSTDSTASAKAITLDTSTAQQYDRISQEISGQILNMLGYNPSAGLGAIGQSKTGVGAQTQRMTMDDASQEITNLIQDFIKLFLVSGLDLYLSEMAGEDPGVLFVDDETKEDIEAIVPGRFGDPANPNALGVDWGKLYDYIQKIDISVDTTISKDDFTNEKRKDLQDALTVMKQTGDPNDPATLAKIDAVENEFLEETIPDLSQKLNKVGATPPQGAPQPGGQPAMRPPAESISFGDAVKAGALDTAAALAEQAGLPANDLRTASPTTPTPTTVALPPQPPR